MSESIRDIRARTRARIEELDAKRESEIRSLKDKHARDLEALRRENKARQDEMRSRIVEMEKKQAEQISRGLTEMAEETRRLKEDLQRRFNARSKELEAEIALREKKLQAKITALFDDFNRRIKELTDKIADQEEREREFALVSLRQAEAILKRISASETVQEFRAEMLAEHHRAHGSIQSLIDQKQWPGVASASMLLGTQCLRTEAEADAELHVWEYWNAEALTPIRQLLRRLREAEIAAWGFSRGGLQYTCAPLMWNEEPLRELENELKEAEAPLSTTRPRCALEAMKRVTMEEFRYEARLDVGLDRAEELVGAFLLMAQVLDVISTEVPYMAPDWEVSEEAALQEIEVYGSMAFRRTSGSYGEMQITVQPASEHGGSLMLRISYDGTRSQDARRRELFGLCKELADFMRTDAGGAIVLGKPSEFADGDKICVNIPVEEGVGLAGIWMPEVAESLGHPRGATAGQTTGDGRKGVATV